MTKPTENLTDLIHKLEVLIRSNPDRMAVNLWNATLLELLRNQMRILDKIGLDSSKKKKPTKKSPKKKVAKKKKAPKKKVAKKKSKPSTSKAKSPANSPANSKVEPYPTADPSVVETALERFEADDLNLWLTQKMTFQLRGDLAFINLNSMGWTSLDEVRGQLSKMGYVQDIGQIRDKRVTGKVFLLSKG